jgi:hypothetical protein
MLSALFSASRRALAACLLLWGAPTLAQTVPAWVDPLSGPNNTAAQEFSASRKTTRMLSPIGSVTERTQWREQAARDLAFRYLRLWSAPNRVTLASASSLYAPTVTFHGQTRTLASVIAEKRRFAQRWPYRTYRHRPETTQVLCEDGGARCTVRSSFDFTAATARGDRRSLGIGEHELVVGFTLGNPVIIAENSRVIMRRHGNMTRFLKDGF